MTKEALSCPSDIQYCPSDINKEAYVLIRTKSRPCPGSLITTRHCPSDNNKETWSKLTTCQLTTSPM